MSEIIRPFHIMAKPVCGVCNLDCRYCYYTMKPRALYPGAEKFQMSEEVLESYTRQYLELSPDRCEFGWQGGEPLLAGKEFFRKAIELQQRFRRPGQTVTNGLQTNGTLLDEEWCDLLRQGDFLVGISIDGPAQVHDVFRLDHAGRPTFERAWAGLERLAAGGVEFNVLVTLNSANAPWGGNLYRFFVNRGVRYLQFIPILERQPGRAAAEPGVATAEPGCDRAEPEGDEPTDFSCGGRQYGEFLLDVFEQWAARDVGRVSVRFFDDVLHTILFGHAATCVHSERCAAAYVLEWNGDLYACDHFVYPEWRIGNVMETPLVDLARSPRLEEFAALKTDRPAACRDCEFLRFCWAGCPKHHRPIGRQSERVNHFCEGHKMFYERALPELERIAEYVRDGRLPPNRPDATAAARTPVARPASPAVSGPPLSPTPGQVRQRRDSPGRAGHATPGAAGPIGRNDPCPCGSGRKYKHCCGRR